MKKNKLIFFILIFSAFGISAQIPAEFPRFIVPGHEGEMESLRAMFWLYYQESGPLIPLWDEWLPMSTLWPACGAQAQPRSMRTRWATTLAEREMSSDGYIHTQQHDGPAHAEGWPFPKWMQGGGIGWHFCPVGVPGYEPPIVNPEGWIINGGRGGEITTQGWVVELTEPYATAQTPPFSVDATKAPWLRLNWRATGIDHANCYVEWTTEEQPQFSIQRRAYFTPAKSDSQTYTMLPMGSKDLMTSYIETRSMIPVYRIPEWRGTITGLRIGFDNLTAAKVVLKSVHTAFDTRHNINNSNFIRGCHDYFLWTHDVTFLREQIGRLRSAMRFMMNEFNTRQKKCIYTTWPGHEGRSGVRWSTDGQKIIVRGEGIGSNYWDLLPFGGEDALATIYYYDALFDLADIEEQIGNHPQWSIATGAEAFNPADLRDHARQVKEYGGKRFWNKKTGRLGTVDLDGVLHDYGFTFLNNEAVYYDFTTPTQAKSIRDWISGRRIVKDDQSTGADIYHWRFGPRTTTRRNIDYYFWGWGKPEKIPWGFQVQDGGAVLGFSYHDLMARLIADGPKDAWNRLAEILVWFDETRASGGYRAFYQDPAHGTMQGGNVAGGLGLDKEFFESILVPQVMLYGFLGFRPTVDGFALHPRLPKEWPELTITNIHLQECTLDITVRDNIASINKRDLSVEPLIADLPDGWILTSSPVGQVISR